MNKNTLWKVLNMLFRKQTERRSIEEILTPKIDDELVEEIDSAEDGKSEKEEESILNTTKVQNDKKEKKETKPINSLDCFGMEEERTEKWLLKCVRFWYCMMSFLWFIIGALTFAPVIYISSKVERFFDNKMMTYIWGCAAYAMILVALILIF